MTPRGAGTTASAAPSRIRSGRAVLILFILFSTFLAATGIGDFFVRLATAVAGRLVGGPAKVSVFSSALFGTISGSGVANVMIDGVFLSGRDAVSEWTQVWDHSHPFLAGERSSRPRRTFERLIEGNGA